ncbi:MAG: alpha/beta fold hydrolase [Chitinophagales bacterium]
MNMKIQEQGKFKFVEVGEGEVLLLLHGLFGALSNFSELIEQFSTQYKVVLPFLPIYELPLRKATLPNLQIFVEDFVNFRQYERVIVLGNSLGGHISLLYTLNNPEKVAAMILTGSSGLFENAMGATFPKRGSYEYMKDKVEYTFYDPKTATKELVDEVFEIVNNRGKALRILSVAKSAIRHNLSEDLPNITIPSFLIWGTDDKVTPPFVAHEFQKLLPDSELKFIEKCGHAPMMERPQIFNEVLSEFLAKLKIES